MKETGSFTSYAVYCGCVFLLVNLGITVNKFLTRELQPVPTIVETDVAITCLFDGPVAEGEWVVSSTTQAGYCHAVKGSDDQIFHKGIVIGRYTNGKVTVWNQVLGIPAQ